MRNRENQRRNIPAKTEGGRSGWQGGGAGVQRGQQPGSDNGRQWDRIRFLHANFAPGIVP